MRPTQIHGLSEQRQLVRGGKLKIGRKKTILSKGKEVEIPEKIDFIRFCPHDESLQEDFRALYGPEPKSLQVVLPSDRREDVFPQALCCWKAGKLWCTGDNRTATRRDFGAGTMQEIPCNDSCPFRYVRDPVAGETDEQRKQRTCKPEGMLRLLLPELPTSHVFELRCGKLSIIRVNTCLDVIEQLAGRIGFIPLTLSLVPQQVVVGKSAMTVYLIHLDVRTSLLELAAGRGRTAGFLGPGIPVADQVEGDLVEEDVELEGEELAGKIDALYGPEEGKAAAPPAPAGAPPPMSEEEKLEAACKELIEGFPEAERPSLHKTLKNLKGMGDLVGFKAYLGNRVQEEETRKKKGTAAVGATPSK